MNEKALTFALVASSLAVAAGVAIESLSAKDEKTDQEKEGKKEDKRPLVDTGVRTKASPTKAEQRASKPGRLATGEFVVWTITATHEKVRIAPPCVIPNCWTLADGGWDDTSVVDCRATGASGLPDGGPRWNGCNVIPIEDSVGAQCVPTACTVDYTGEPDHEVLR